MDTDKPPDEEGSVVLSPAEAKELQDAFLQLSPDVMQTQRRNLRNQHLSLWGLYRIRHAVLSKRVRVLLNGGAP